MKSSTIIKSAVAAGAFAAAGVATASANSVTVKSGDTLNQIARANGTTVDALVKANGINNPNLIFVGQQLQTEGTASAAQAKPAQAPATATNGAYTVKAGDTLYRIAAANGTSVATLVAANNIQNLNFISVGQVLNLSGNATPVAAPAAKQVTQPEVEPATVATAQTVAPAQQTTTVTTQAAETTTATTQVTPVAQTTTPAVQPAQTATPNSAIQTLLNTLNAKRSALGLGPVSLDAGLSARAAARAANAVANGGLPVNHFRTNGEVVAIGWGYGDVVNAWFNETNMVTNGTPGHRMWVANPRATSVGFGIVGDTIVAESDAGQY
ncbi:LysM peptidoglycan-binding domain-containing protein [Leuconostoc citreum]|uniref:LysM peptidoglycan-binding domain-containing protein n=1 Tax=Leuconostoc citreum TaxID=33964 RepID=UPI0032DE7094